MHDKRVIVVMQVFPIAHFGIFNFKMNLFPISIRLALNQFSRMQIVQVRRFYRRTSLPRSANKRRTHGWWGFAPPNPMPDIQSVHEVFDPKRWDLRSVKASSARTTDTAATKQMFQFWNGCAVHTG